MSRLADNEIIKFINLFVISDEESYLAIKLNTEEDIKLETLQIIDMSNEVVSEKSLKLIIEKDKFYLTDPFIPPDITFRIAVRKMFRGFWCL